MLVYYFGHVDGTLEQVAAAITDSGSDLSAWAKVAYRRGEELQTRIHPGPFLPAKEVSIELGAPHARSGSVIIPLSWKATGVEALFPAMDADLVLQPIGPNLVEVVFRGSYEPPLRGFGRILDRAVMHRLAEASAKTFLDQLCSAVETAIASDGKQDPDSGAVTDPAVDGGVAPGLFGPSSQAG